jgi:hypothetical protein|tara:strand:- start:167 stop:388 length:222 start_codon:yes stop_codon:yes gene_type:complete
MGQLKRHCLTALEERGDEVMDCYGIFLEQVMKDHSLPHSYDDALKHVANELGMYLFEVRYVVEERTESLYDLF